MKYPLEHCMGSRVRALSRKIDAIYRQNLGNSGVTENQLSIMMALYKTGIIEQKIISEILILEKSSLSRNLIRLIEGGYVEKNGPANRPMIALTESGIEKVEALIPQWEAAMDKIYSALDEKDRTAFSILESRIKQL